MKREVITNLMSLLERDNDLTRCWAAKALGNIGAQEAMPALIERLYQPSTIDRFLNALSRWISDVLEENSSGCFRT